jgi:hypothetical protein
MAKDITASEAVPDTHEPTIVKLPVTQDPPVKNPEIGVDVEENDTTTHKQMDVEGMQDPVTENIVDENPVVVENPVVEEVPVVDETPFDDSQLNVDETDTNPPFSDEKIPELDNAEDPTVLDAAAGNMIVTSSPVEHSGNTVSVGGRIFVDVAFVADELQYWVNKNETPSGSTGNLAVLNEAAAFVRSIVHKA